MQSYRERIELALAPFLSSGFAVVQILDEQSRHFGNARIVLSSAALDLRMTSDRGQMFLDVKRPDDSRWLAVSEILTAIHVRPQMEWRDAGEAVEAYRSHATAIGDILDNPERKNALIGRP